MALNLIGLLTWQKKPITDEKSLGVKRLKSATCHRGVTVVFFFFMVSEVFVFNTNGSFCGYLML